MCSTCAPPLPLQFERNPSSIPGHKARYRFSPFGQMTIFYLVLIGKMTTGSQSIPCLAEGKHRVALVARDVKHDLYVWSTTDGFRSWGLDVVAQAQEHRVQVESTAIIFSYQILKPDVLSSQGQLAPPHLEAHDGVFHRQRVQCDVEVLAKPAHRPLVAGF